MLRPMGKHQKNKCLDCDRSIRRRNSRALRCLACSRRRRKLLAPVYRRFHAALRGSVLQRPTSCESCGAERLLHGHHDDYSQPLSVRWLCPTCHVNHHNRTNGTFSPSRVPADGIGRRIVSHGHCRPCGVIFRWASIYGQRRKDGASCAECGTRLSETPSALRYSSRMVDVEPRELFYHMEATR